MNEQDTLNRTALIADALVSGLDRFPQDLAYLYTALDYLHIATAEDCQIVPSSEGQNRDAAGLLCQDRVQFGPLLLDVCAAERSIAKRASRIVDEVRLFTETRFPDDWARMVTRLSDARGSWRIGRESAVFGTTREAPDLTQMLFREVASAVAEPNPHIGKTAPRIEYIVSYAAAPGGCVLVAPGWDSPIAGQSAQLHRAILQAFETGLVGWSGDEGTVTFAVPCVVGSVPWVIAAIELDASDWRTAYTLYRDVLPRRFEQIRATVRLLYIQTIIEIVDTELAHDIFEPARLNEVWCEAAASFPFRTPQIRELDDHEADPDAVELRGSRWVVEPAANPFFAVRIEAAGGASWGELEELAPLLTSSLRSRFELGQRDRRELAQDVAHEFKNMSTGLSLAASDLWRRTRGTRGLPDWVQSGIEAISTYGRQLNAVSLTLYMLARDGSAFKFEASQDGPKVVQAAARVMLHLRSCVDPRLLVEDQLELPDALSLLQARSRWRTSRRRRDISDLVADENVALLLFAVAEPVRNIREARPLREGRDCPIRVWTQVDEDDGSVLIHQVTLENRGAELELDSEGVRRVNAFLPKDFCSVDPIIRPPDGTRPEPVEGLSGAVQVHRCTRITVLGVPIPPKARR